MSTLSVSDEIRLKKLRANFNLQKAVAEAADCLGEIETIKILAKDIAALSADIPKSE